MEIRISVEGSEEVKRALADPQLIKGPMALFLRDSVSLLERTAKQAVPVDRGQLRSSITREIAPLRAAIYTVVNYAPAVEMGTKPHRPPFAAIYDWVRHKRGAFGLGGHIHGAKRQASHEAALRSLTFAIIGAIAKRGTRAKPFMRPAADLLRDAMGGLMAKLGRDIEAHFASKQGRGGHHGR